MPILLLCSLGLSLCVGVGSSLAGGEFLGGRGLTVEGCEGSVGDGDGGAEVLEGLGDELDRLDGAFVVSEERWVEDVGVSSTEEDEGYRECECCRHCYGY